MTVNLVSIQGKLKMSTDEVMYRMRLASVNFDEMTTQEILVNRILLSESISRSSRDRTSRSRSWWKGVLLRVNAGDWLKNDDLGIKEMFEFSACVRRGELPSLELREYFANRFELIVNDFSKIHNQNKGNKNLNKMIGSSVSKHLRLQNTPGKKNYREVSVNQKRTMSAAQSIANLISDECNLNQAAKIVAKKTGLRKERLLKTYNSNKEEFTRSRRSEQFEEKSSFGLKQERIEAELVEMINQICTVLENRLLFPKQYWKKSIIFKCEIVSAHVLSRDAAKKVIATNKSEVSVSRTSAMLISESYFYEGQRKTPTFFLDEWWDWFLGEPYFYFVKVLHEYYCQ